MKGTLFKSVEKVLQLSVNASHLILLILYSEKVLECIEEP